MFHHYINLALLFVAGLNLGLAVVIWSWNPKHIINISLALSITFLASWTLGMAMFRESSNELTAWAWTWLQNGSGSLIVISFYILSIYFPYQTQIIKPWQYVAMAASVVVMLLIVFIPGAWIVKINLNPTNNDYELNRFGLTYFNIHFYLYLVLAFQNLFKKYSSMSGSGFAKTQLFFLLTSGGIIALFGSIFAAFVPFVYGHLGPYWLGPFFSLPMIAILLWFMYRTCR